MNKEVTIVSDDHRRTLAEFGNGYNWRVGKYVVVKDRLPIGDHYHKLKTELFLIISGEVKYQLQYENGMVSTGTAKQGKLIEVPPNTYHVFYCEPGTIFIGLATEEHDPTDDYKL